MRLDKIALVKATFDTLGSNANAAAELFYQRLFELDPTLKPMFTNDPVVQAAKFMATLRLAVTGLDRPEMIVTEVKRLGREHVGYGVRDEHYHTAGQALMWALGQSLGSDFTPEVEAAWNEAYTLVAGLMEESAHS
jgi:hemoglobin-like flavoprotein